MVSKKIPEKDKNTKTLTIKAKSPLIHKLTQQLFDQAKSQNVTLPELGEISGWGYSTLSLTRSGKRRMHIQMMTDVADSLGLEIIIISKSTNKFK